MEIQTKVQFSIKEPMTKTEIKYQWLKYRIRHYMILEVFVLVVLVLLLSNSYHISSQNLKTYELISSLQSRIDRIEKKLDLNKVLSEFLKEQTFKEIKPSRNAKTNSSQRKNIEATAVSTNCSIPHFNAANILSGASVDTNYSSSYFPPQNEFFEDIGSMTMIGDQSGYVILDREEIPSNKAWCSDVKNPILTVKLAQYIKPTAVSYQHTRWNGTVPNGAPKIYDLVACIDSDCKEIVPLATNCKYETTMDNKQEQTCLIPFNRNATSINKVQFRFRENHGNITTTCAYLVRVYRERRGLQKNKKEVEEDVEACLQLTYRYNKIPTIYKLMQKYCILRSLYNELPH